MKPTPTLSDRKRAAIIDAAIDAFLVHGFDGASMDLIAQHANVSKRTVYNHFSSKELLFEEIVRRLKDKAGSEASFVYLRESPLMPQLFAFCRRVTDFHCAEDSRKLVRILVSRFLQAPEMAQAMFGNAKIFEVELCQWIRKAQRDLRIADCNTIFVAKQLLALIETFVIWPQLIKNSPVPKNAERNHIATSAAEMFLARYATVSSINASKPGASKSKMKSKATR